MINYIWFGMIALSVVCATVNGRLPELSQAVMDGAGDAVELVGPGVRPFGMVAPEMADKDGLPLFEPRTPQSLFCMKLPRPVPPWTIVRRAVELSAK